MQSTSTSGYYTSFLTGDEHTKEEWLNNVLQEHDLYTCDYCGGKFTEEDMLPAGDAIFCKECYKDLSAYAESE